MSPLSSKLSRNPEKVMDRAAARTMPSTDFTEGMTEFGFGHSPNPYSSEAPAGVRNATGNTGIGEGLATGDRLGHDGQRAQGSGIASAMSQGTQKASDVASEAADKIPRDHQGGMNPLKAFGSKGSIGSQFEPSGVIGQVPQKIGGPLDKDGVIGRQFTSEGVVGGAVDEAVGDKNPKDPLGRYDNKK